MTTVVTHARPDARALLKAARDELDAIVAWNRDSDTASRLDAVTALIEEAMADLDGGRR